MTQLGIPDVLGVRFFTNAIDTETKGFDIVADYTFDLAGSSLAVSAAYNKSETDVVHVDPNPAVLDALGVGNVLFGVEEQNTLETAAPDDKLILTGAVDQRALVDPRPRQPATAKRSACSTLATASSRNRSTVPNGVWTSMSSSRSRKGLSVAVGGNNILDEYPDLSSPTSTTSATCRTTCCSRSRSTGRSTT